MDSFNPHPGYLGQRGRGKTHQWTRWSHCGPRGQERRFFRKGNSRAWDDKWMPKCLYRSIRSGRFKARWQP